MTDEELFDHFGHPDNFTDVEHARRGIAELRRMLDEGRGVAERWSRRAKEIELARRADRGRV